MVSNNSEAMNESAIEQHVQISFFSAEEIFKKLPDDVFDVPVSADPEKLNLLLNASMQNVVDGWAEKNVELLIGDTFIRTSLEEFIEEFSIQTENVIKVECIIRSEAPSPKHDLPAPDWVSSVHIWNKNIFSTTYNGEVICWNPQGEAIFQIQRDKGSSYKCSNILKNGNSKKWSFVAGGDTLTLFEVEGKTVVPKALFRGHERSVESVCSNKEGTRLLSGSFDSYVKMWNLEDSDVATVYEKVGENVDKAKKRKETHVVKTPIMTLGGHKDAVVGLSWSSWNASNAVSVSWDQTLIVWDLELGGEITKIRGPKAFSSLDIHSKSGLAITANTDAVPRLYDVRSHEGAVVKQSFIGHKGWVSQVVWSPDDTNTFVSCSFDKTVKMWDIRSAKTSLFDLHGHEDRVLCVDWKEKTIASGSVDTTVKVFAV